jgi:hypothetical protein
MLDATAAQDKTHKAPWPGVVAARTREGETDGCPNKGMGKSVSGFCQIQARVPKRDFLRSYLPCRIAWSLPLIARLTLASSTLMSIPFLGPGGRP